MSTDSGTNAPVPKVIAATSGGGLGYAVQVIVVYCIEHFGHQTLPADVKSAGGFILVTLLAFVFGYQAPALQLALPVDVLPIGDSFASVDGPPEVGVTND